MHAAEILRHGQPLVKTERDGVMSVYRVGDSVVARFRRVFCFKTAKHSIPDNKDTGIVFVDVAWVAGMVNTMMRRCVQHPFQYAEALYQLGVDERRRTVSNAYRSSIY